MRINHCFIGCGQALVVATLVLAAASARADHKGKWGFICTSGPQIGQSCLSDAECSGGGSCATLRCIGGSDDGDPCGADADCSALPGEEHGGRCTTAFSWENVAVHMIHLHTGKILVWPGDVTGNDPETKAFVWNFWDTKNEKYTDDAFNDQGFTDVPTKNSNMFCAGHAPLADGRILIAGGDVTGSHVGIVDTNLFDPESFDPDDVGSDPWTAREDLHEPRWYPTLTTLSDGRVLAVSGDHRMCLNDDHEVIVGDDGNFVACPDLEDGEACPGGGTCTLSYATIPAVYDGNRWSKLESAGLCLPFYPFMFLLPDSRVFFAGVEDSVEEKNCRGLEAVPSNQSYVLDVQAAAPTWSQADASKSWGGSAVMYEPGKILKSGGNGSTAGSTTEVIDMRPFGGQEWVEVGQMNFVRRRHQLTALADGTILVTGGTSKGNSEHEQNICIGGTMDGEVCNTRDGISACEGGKGRCVEDHGSEQFWVAEAELFDPRQLASVNDPKDAVWQEVAAASYPRMYHSTALLLPDGRVLSAGSGQGGGALHDYMNAEIYSPPYLFKGPRPTIKQAPPAIRYGDVFEVETPDAASIGKVGLVRLASVTHSFDQNARFVPLAIAGHHGGILEVLAPATSSYAPPGYYMLFIVFDEERNGVPSIAKYVYVGGSGGVEVLWVDFKFTGTELGTFYHPFNTLAKGVGAVRSDHVIRIKGGTTSETPIISKAVRLETYRSPAVVGVPQ